MEQQKSTIIFCHDIVEENGKTVKENNLERNHNIPIDTLVEVKYDDWFGDGACQKVHGRFWVVEHCRDCDGTPLYNLSEHRKAALHEFRCHFGEYAVKNHGPFPEDALTIIDVTPELVYGTGALTWEDE